MQNICLVQPFYHTGIRVAPPLSHDEKQPNQPVTPPRFGYYNSARPHFVLLACIALLVSHITRLVLTIHSHPTPAQTQQSVEQTGTSKPQTTQPSVSSKKPLETLRHDLKTH